MQAGETPLPNHGERNERQEAGMRITDELLEAMGFKLETGFKNETWVYEGAIWVVVGRIEPFARGEVGPYMHLASGLTLKELVKIMCHYYNEAGYGDGVDQSS